MVFGSIVIRIGRVILFLFGYSREIENERVRWMEVKNIFFDEKFKFFFEFGS